MSRPVSRIALAAAALSALIALPGCISLLPETEPDALYRLTTAPAPETRVVEGGETVIIARLAAPRGLAGDRIALERDGRIAYMAGAAWLSPAPVMLHGAIIDAFQTEVPAITPARAEDGVAARYTLDLDLRHFEAIYDGGSNAAPRVQVTLSGRLIDRETRALAASRTVEVSRRAAANRQGAIVDAFSAASAEVAAELATWAEGVICEAGDAPPACQR
jgi:ABC-type uncharacterized transport system, auxiliary component